VGAALAGACSAQATSTVALGVGLGLGIGIPVVVAAVCVVVYWLVWQRRTPDSTPPPPTWTSDDLRLPAARIAEPDVAGWLAKEAARARLGGGGGGGGEAVDGDAGAAGGGGASPARRGRAGGAGHLTPAVVVNGATANGSNRALKILKKSSGVYGGQDVRFHRAQIGRGRRGSQVGKDAVPDDADDGNTGLAGGDDDDDDVERAAGDAASMLRGDLGVVVGGSPSQPRPHLRSAASESTLSSPMSDRGPAGGQLSPMSGDDADVVFKAVPDNEITVDFHPQEGPVLGNAHKQHGVKQLTSTGNDGVEQTMFSVPDSVRSALASAHTKPRK
jgi:hypothetical protein